MAVVPNYVIQQLASGAVIPGTLPLISAAAPNLDSDVIKQVRERMWTYKVIDSTSGGLFESPVNLANDYTQQLARSSAKYRTREALAKIDSPDRIGYSVRRVKFNGTGTTAVTASVINPYGVTATVAAEALTVTPAADGVIKEFTAPLVNDNIMYETFSVRVESAPVGTYDVTLRDRGNGKLSFVDANGSWVDAGTIDYRISPKTGAASVRMRFQIAPPTGATFKADYSHGTAVATYEFLDTALVSSVDPANFDIGIPVTGSNPVIVPPHWSIKFVTVGALSAVGSLGVMYGVGFGQRGGQESPGFGLQL